MKKNLLRTWLVALMAVMGMGAQAQVSTLYERGTEENPWTDADLESWVPTQTSGIGAAIVDGVFTINVLKSGDGGKTGEYTAAIPSGSDQSILTYTVDWNPGNATGKNNSSRGYVKFGDVEFRFFGQNTATHAIIGGVDTDLGAGKRGAAVNMTVVVNQATAEVKYTYTTNGKTVEGTGVTNAVGQFNSFTIGYGGTVPNWANTVTMSKLQITEEMQTVVTADYTVRFVDQMGNELRPADTRTGVVGNGVSLSAADKANFFNDDKTMKYIYVEDDSESAVVAEDGTTVVTVKFREAETWNYAINATADGSVLKTLAEGTVFEGENASVSYPRYIKVGDGLYNREAVSNSYGWSFTPDANGAVGEVAYTMSDIANVVYYSEAEDVASLEAVTDNWVSGRYSSGQGGYAKEDGAKITRLGFGKYRLTARLMSQTAGITFRFRIGNRAIWEHATETGFYYGSTGSFSEEFVVANEADVNLDAAGGFVSGNKASNLIDYIYIEQLDDPTDDELIDAEAADADADLIAPLRLKLAEAKKLVDADAVAVGLLNDAIAVAQAVYDAAGLDDYSQAVAQLQAAIDLFNTNNADVEKDQTAKVATDGWKDYDGNAANFCAITYAPAITTYDGRTANLAEVYEESVDRTGTIIYQDITDLPNGTYKVGFYGNAFYTAGRGFASDMEDGAEDVAYVFANEQQEFIVAQITDRTTENNFRQFDVEVTDGQIKLGMGKAKAGTNWHTMQIYRLTWFTTAKALYAVDKAEMRAAIAAAKALKTEHRTVGVEAIDEAIDEAEAALTNNRLNIDEFEAAIAKIKAAATAFREANYYVYEGDAYIIDTESGKMVAAGNAWGTHGIVNDMGLDLTLAAADNNRVTIDTRISNGEGKHYVGADLYMDGLAYGWALEYQGFGFHITNGTQFVNIDDDDNLVLSDTPREWIIVTKQGVIEERMEELSEATADNGVDATWLLQNPNFNRNDQRVSAWTVSDDCTNKNLNGGNNTNNCAESYHSVFTISQVVADAPKGTYELTAQGFYNQDGDVEEDAPVFFINDATIAVSERTGSENSMSQASESFTAGLYASEPIKVFFDGEGELTVGVKGTAVNQWVIFDNFRLTYYGVEDSTTGIDEVSTKAVAAGAIYNLAGQKVAKAQKGLYIIDGKKVVK